MLARGKLKSIESIISKALKNNEIEHENFDTIIDEEKKYRDLKESIRMMNSQRSDAEKIKLIEEGKQIGINEFINNGLKPQISHLHIKMKSYCLKCKNAPENIIPRVSKTSNNKNQNFQNVELKNQDSLKIKKQKNY